MKGNLKTKKIQVPSHVFGIIAAASQLGSQIGNALQQSGNVELGSAISGAANPLMAGMQYMGNSDVSVGNKLLAFTGLGSVFAARQAKEAAEKRAANISNAQTGLRNTALMQDEYWSENDLAQTYLNGGINTGNLAFLDNGELVRDVNGNISEVPNTMPGEDAHLVNATGMESVLSDTLKRPGTNETFADAGKKILNKLKKSPGSDIRAINTNILNDYNVQSAYNDLLMEQEMYKNKKGIKPTSKEAVVAAKNGLLMAPSLAQTVKHDLSPISQLRAPSLKVQGAMPDLSPISGAASAIPALRSAATAAAPAAVSALGGAGGILGMIGSLAPVISNTLQGLQKDEVETPYQNPYTPTITSAMARRRYDIDPLLSDITRQSAIGRYNLANISPNTGSNLAAATQMAVDQQTARARAYAERSNINNQYLGDYAQTLNNLGAQYNQTVATTREQNAANRAMRRNYLNEASSQFGQWAQAQQQMTNQQARDNMMMPFLSQFLSQGYDANTMRDFYNNYYKRGR